MHRFQCANCKEIFDCERYDEHEAYCRKITWNRDHVGLRTEDILE